MRYINTKANEIIIRTPISKSTTKTTSKKTNKVTENTKYRGYLPEDIIILLLERDYNNGAGNDADFNPDNINVTAWINKLILENNIYLKFTSTEDDIYNDNKYVLSIENTSLENSFIVKKQNKLDSYYFTVSKKLFNLLKNSERDNFILEYRIKFVSGGLSLDNCVVSVLLV